MMGIAALLPYKGVNSSKTRLSGILSPLERRQFSLEMLEKVMQAIFSSEGIQKRILLGGDICSCRLAANYNFSIMACDNIGLNQSLHYALQILEKDGIDKALIIPGDLPLITASAIQTMIKAFTRSDLVISPSWDLGGTNALGLPTKYAEYLCYGKESFARHLKNFAQLGKHVSIFYCRNLAIDIDTPKEYDCWMNSCFNDP